MREIILLPASELCVMAAAGGMEHLLTFSSETLLDRETLLQAIFRMVKEGLLIQEGASLLAGAPLRPMLDVLRDADTAITVKNAGNAAPPVCAYLNSREQTALWVAPHPCKRDLYEVHVVRREAMLADWEAVRILPADRSGDFGAADGESLPETGVPDASWSDEELGAALGCEAAAAVQRYRMPGCQEAGRLLLLQSPFAQYGAVYGEAGETVRLFRYSKELFCQWLGGTLE